MQGLNSTGKSSTGVTGAIALTRAQIENGYGTDIGHGDPVHVDPATGFLVASDETVAPTHVFRGIQYVDNRDEWVMDESFTAGTVNTGTVEGFTNVVAIVETVADKLFLATTDAATPFTQDMVGKQFRLANTGRNPATGRSTAVVDLAAAVGAELRLVEITSLKELQGNSIGETEVSVFVKLV